MTTVLVDTSVLIKWFHSDGESELEEARAIRRAAARGDVGCRVIDLALYEMGNVLVRSLGWQGSDVADQLEDLLLIAGTPLIMTPTWLRRAADVGAAYRLTFYDSAWAAAALELGVPLVSSDQLLVTNGLAESPTSLVRRLQLPLGS